MESLSRFTIVVFIAIALLGCKTRRIVQEVPIEIHDTTYRSIIQTRIDTLWKMDSISIIDTMWIDTSTIATLGMPVLHHNRTTTALSNQGKVSNTNRVDTFLLVKEIPKIVKQKEYIEVEKPLYWWQKALMWIGGISFGILFAIFVYKLKK